MIDFRKSNTGIITLSEGQILLKYSCPDNTQHSIASKPSSKPKTNIGRAFSTSIRKNINAPKAPDLLDDNVEVEDEIKVQWSFLEDEQWADSTIFISYARNINKVEHGEEIGWVDIFSKSLERQLGIQGRRNLESGKGIWKDDNNLNGNDSVSDTIKKTLDKTQILVVLLSPAYINSQYCLQEIDYFQKIHGCDSKRIFIINHGKVSDREYKHIVKNDCLGYCFHCKKGMEYSNSEKAYKYEILKLSVEINNLLEKSMTA